MQREPEARRESGRGVELSMGRGGRGPDHMKLFQATCRAGAPCSVYRKPWKGSKLGSDQWKGFSYC